MERVDAGGEEPMNVDNGRREGQEDESSLTARVDAMSEMFAKIMTGMTSSEARFDSIMMSLGPQGPQALEMGATKEQMKQSEEKNEVRFKKLEETVYQNKFKEVRFDETANKGGGLTKGLVKRLMASGKLTWGVPALLALRRMVGFLEILGDSKSWGSDRRGVRADRLVSIVGTLGVRMGRVPIVVRPRTVGCG